MRPDETGVRERLGEAIGGWLAPLLATIARMRGARVFHPEGALFRGVLEPTVTDGPYAELAQRLGRTVLARCSPALWRNGFEHLEVLGIALRFHDGELAGVAPAAGDQDLLFATIRSPFTMGLAPFTTNAHDFLANDYFAVSPFAFGGDHRIELRLLPLDRYAGEGTRAAKLAAAVESGAARFGLEVRRTLRLGWHAIAEVRLVEAVELDQRALRFDPFQNGAGLEPVGTVHAIRRAAYGASQAGRHAPLTAA